MLSGTIHPDYYPLARAFERMIDRVGGGAAACIYQHGEKVVDLWGGVRDEAGNPWERDTVSVSYSTTKGVASTALHMCVDRGLLDYDDKVAEHWPEFGAAGKGDVTVRDVMTHRAGLHDIRSLVEHASEMLDWDRMTSLLAAAPAAPVPEDRSAYHALTYGYLVGELVRRVTGEPLGEFIRTEISEPLGLDGLFIGTPSDQLHRAAQLVWKNKSRRNDVAARPSDRTPAQKAAAAKKRKRIARAIETALRIAGLDVDFRMSAAALAPRGIADLDFSSHEVLRASIPAANGAFTARSLARMYAALANGGELDGVRLLSRETLDRATEVQVRGRDQVIIFPMYWRLGYHRVGTLRGRVRGAYGHFGFGGSGAWACPRRNMSFALVLNAGTGTPMGDTRILRLNTVALQCAKARWERAGRPPVAATA